MANIILALVLVFAGATSLVMLIRLIQVAGLFIKEKRLSQNVILEDSKLPSITIMIPAYNEEKVIRRTLDGILKVDYPDDKLEIMIINPASKDRTSEIVNEVIRQTKRNLVLYDAAGDFIHQGKPHALNLGMKKSKGDILIVYDADSKVDPKSPKYLASYLAMHSDVAIAFGMRKALNPHTFFGRLAYVESLSQQLLTEAAPPKENNKKFLFAPGTNLALRKDIMQKEGGWEDFALTEDFELSLRLQSRGYKIKYVPEALAFEEVVENISVWLAQRTRWARGGGHVFAKALKDIGKTAAQVKNANLNWIILSNMLDFYAPVFGLILADLLFIFALIEFLTSGAGIGFLLFVVFYASLSLQLIACTIYAKDFSLKNTLSSLFLFIYYQLWIIIFIKVLWLDLTRAQTVWQKTERFTAGEKK